jgi:hypothetical protein
MLRRISVGRTAVRWRFIVSFMTAALVGSLLTFAAGAPRLIGTCTITGWVLWQSFEVWMLSRILDEQQEELYQLDEDLAAERGR